MIKTRTLCLGLATLLTAIGHSQNGVQAVLFSRWSKESLDNFLQVASSEGPNRIVIAVAPFFNASAPFKNMKQTVTRLRKSGKNVTFIVHLSFHRDDDKSFQSVSKRASKLRSFMQSKIDEPGHPLHGKTMAQTARFVVCPQLEDEWGRRGGDPNWGNFNAYAETFVNGFTTVNTRFSPKAFELLRDVDLLRCVADGSNKFSSGQFGGLQPQTFVLLEPSSYKFTRKFKAGQDKNGKPIFKVARKTWTIQRETHVPHVWSGIFEGFDLHSNDGDFVYAPFSTQIEIKAGRSFLVTEDANAFGQGESYRPSLADYISFAASKPVERPMLWRPAYNLFRMTPSVDDTEATWNNAPRAKDGSVRIRFTRQQGPNGSFEPDDPNLKDDCSFNSREVDVLRAFWR